MKNLLTLLIALGFVFAVTACGGESSSYEESDEAATESVEGTEDAMETEDEATEEEATEEEATEEDADDAEESSEEEGEEEGDSEEE